MHLLLTGKPAVGKTTVIMKIVDVLKKLGIKMAGFYTAEMRENNKRVGFEIITIPDQKRGLLAHISMNSPFRVSRYGVDVASFERLVLPIFSLSGLDFLIIDEIGKMELFSKRFEEEVLRALGRKIPKVIGVIQEKQINIIKGLDDVKLYWLCEKNRDQAPKEILRSFGLTTF